MLHSLFLSGPFRVGLSLLTVYSCSQYISLCCDVFRWLTSPSLSLLFTFFCLQSRCMWRGDVLRFSQRPLHHWNMQRDRDAELPHWAFWQCWHGGEESSQGECLSVGQRNVYSDDLCPKYSFSFPLLKKKKYLGTKSNLYDCNRPSSRLICHVCIGYKMSWGQKNSLNLGDELQARWSGNKWRFSLVKEHSVIQLRIEILWNRQHTFLSHL